MSAPTSSHGHILAEIYAVLIAEADHATAQRAAERATEHSATPAGTGAGAETEVHDDAAVAQPSSR